MCKECWLETRPERGTTCLDKGSYVINFKGCHACGKRDFIAEEGRVEEEEDDEEDDDEDEEGRTHPLLITAGSDAMIKVRTVRVLGLCV